MELATMSKVMGRFLLALFAGLVPATQPFVAPSQRSTASLPTGEFVENTNAPNGIRTGEGDSVSIERRKNGGYRVVCRAWRERPTEFDAELFELGKDHEGQPAYFLDLRPRTERPETRGLPTGATHLAARVRWVTERGRAWLSFDAVDREWLDERKPSREMSAEELRASLRRALDDDAFSVSLSLTRR